MSDRLQYWLRIIGALALIKAATTLVRDAEKLITSSVKANNPEIADELGDTLSMSAIIDGWREPADDDQPPYGENRDVPEKENDETGD